MTSKIEDLRHITETWLLPTKLHNDILKYIFELEEKEWMIMQLKTDVGLIINFVV